MQADSNAARVAIRYIQDWLGQGTTWFEEDLSSTRRRAYLSARPASDTLIEVVEQIATGRLRIVWHLDSETIIHGLPGVDALSSYLDSVGDKLLEWVEAQFQHEPAPSGDIPPPATTNIIAQVIKMAPRWQHWTEPFGRDRRAIYFGRPHSSFYTARAHAWLILDHEGNPAEVGRASDGEVVSQRIANADDFSAWLEEIGTQYQSSLGTTGDAPNLPAQQSAPATSRPRSNSSRILAQLLHHERCAAARFARSSSERLLFAQLPSESETEALLHSAAREYRRQQYLGANRIPEIVMVGRLTPSGSLALEALEAMDSDSNWRPDLLVVFELDKVLSSPPDARRLIREAARRGAKVAAGVQSVSIVHRFSRELLEQAPTARALLISRGDANINTLQRQYGWRVVVLERMQQRHSAPVTA